MRGPTGPRNEFGVKSSASRWRTFGGERFECWNTDWSPEYVALYRAAGIRVRKFEGETYMRPQDFRRAAQIDAARHRP